MPNREDQKPLGVPEKTVEALISIVVSGAPEVIKKMDVNNSGGVDIVELQVGLSAEALKRMFVEKTIPVDYLSQIGEFSVKLNEFLCDNAKRFDGVEITEGDIKEIGEKLKGRIKIAAGDDCVLTREEVLGEIKNIKAHPETVLPTKLINALKPDTLDKAPARQKV